MKRIFIASLIAFIGFVSVANADHYYLRKTDASEAAHPAEPVAIIPETQITGNLPFSGYSDRDVSGVSNNVDLWRGPTDVQPEPVPAGFQPVMVSAAAGDDDTGTGIQSVQIHYLDTAGAMQSETKATDGTGADVTFDATDVMFINEAHATAVGSGLVAAGNIDIKNGATVMNRIAIAGNYALSTMRMVPTGYTGYIKRWHGESVHATAQNVIVRPRGSYHEMDVHVGVYLFKDVGRTRNFGTGAIPFDPVEPVPGGATFKMSLWTTGSVDASGGWRGYLEPNP